MKILFSKIFSPFTNAFGWWKSLKLPFKIISILLTAVLFGLLAYGATLFLFETDIINRGNLSAMKNNSVELVVPTPIPIRYSPINGIQIDHEKYDATIARHPLAITINNHEEARPQSGLGFADVVMEVLAEGGITRYVAVYHNNYNVAKIGPVRSLRYYMIDFASGYNDAMILHHGWAGHDGAAFETYNPLTDARGAVSKFGIKNIQTTGSTYRDPLKVRSAGSVHALYTGFDKILPEIDRLQKAGNWQLGVKEFDGLTFKADAPLEERGSFQSVAVKFISLSTTAYNAGFTYDRANNLYPRTIGGKPDIDELTGEQIAPKNVIIEWHEYQDGRDGHSRIVLTMIGENKATILRDGSVIEATWKKECRTCMTKYYDAAGAEIPLNRGQVWIVNAVKVQDRLLSTVTIQ